MDFPFNILSLIGLSLWVHHQDDHYDQMDKCSGWLNLTTCSLREADMESPCQSDPAQGPYHLFLREWAEESLLYCENNWLRLRVPTAPLELLETNSPKQGCLRGQGPSQVFNSKVPGSISWLISPSYLRKSHIQVFYGASLSCKKMLVTIKRV